MRLETTFKDHEKRREMSDHPKSTAEPVEPQVSEGANGAGPRAWRSLDELASAPNFSELLHREFPRFAAVWDDGFDRRRFLQLASASLAAAGLGACTKQPPENIVPYVKQPEEIVPGKPLFFATAAVDGGYARGILAESHMGRPTKIEGNPDHPASLGGTDVHAQASVLELYDPDRSQSLVKVADIRSWATFTGELGQNLAALEPVGGQGLYLLTGAVSSPTLLAQIAELRAKFPEMRWHTWEPAGRQRAFAGAESAFGEKVEVRYEVKAADVILALDSDFLTSGPGAVRYAKDFAARRRVHAEGQAEPNRLYAVETTPSNTGATADHRLALGPAELGHFAAALAAELGVEGVEAPSAALEGAAADWLAAVAEDLRAHAGRSLVVVGDHAPEALHVLAHAINAHLGNLGTTAVVTDPVLAADADGSLAELYADMVEGKIDSLITIGTNPVYDAPADYAFQQNLRVRVRFRVHVGSHRDETAEFCDWHVPLSHALESWGDARSFDGTATICQPLIQPLYESKCAAEVLAAMLGETEAEGEELVRAHWQETWGDSADFELRFRRALHDGLVEDSAFAPRPAQVDPEAVVSAAAELTSAASDGFEVLLRPDPTIHDGRWANNGWLQECPKPITRLTWDNALLVSPATFEDLGLGKPFQYGDQRPETPMVRLTAGERSLEVAVWAVPGHAPGVGTLHLGYGRERCGRVGAGTGFNAYHLRTAENLWHLGGVTVEPTGETYHLASTQDHFSMEGRDLARSTTVERLESGHPFDHHLHVDPSLSLMNGEDFPYDSYAWGMTIDLSACTGCNACLVACQSENNIPTVGKEQVMAGREMHWIRIDRYFVGDDAENVSAILHQPVICQQCEQAPCEVVCPVAATVHSDEGLNDMVYNRCVGTRYCSNNCPYKVRRFNFLLYADFDTPQLQLGRNPDVTIRSRGVMEKCTYCVQRINHARIEAKREDRKIRDGEIQTACQQACPSDALVFGDVNDGESRVSKIKGSPLNYQLLAELGTRPRTSYVAKLRNPNPALEPHEPNGHGSDGHGAGEQEAHG